MRNNFNGLRLGAAIAVLVSHAFTLTATHEPMMWLSAGQTSLGTIAVVVFFIISGYLITKSFARSNDPAGFIAARALRLLPAMAITLVILAVIVGPIVSTEPVAAYFSQSAPVKFVLVDLSLTGLSDHLPGVFTTSRYPNAVDGSLWTLRFEAECYVAVLLLGIAGGLNRWVIAGVFVAGLAATTLWLGGERVRFETCFAAGAALYLWNVPLKRSVFLACCAVTLLALLTHGFRIAAATTGAYAILYIALAIKPIGRPAAKGGSGDLSYGVYLWAFPVQQIVAAAVGPWWTNILISLPITLGLAWLSWRFVEAPALALKPAYAARLSALLRQPRRA